MGCRRAPERTCRAGTAPLSRCAPWSFHHISGVLWQCLCWEVKLQNPEHVDAVIWKFTSSFLSIQCKPCCKTFVSHTALEVPSDHISMLKFFLVSQNVLCLSELFYSGLLMDSRERFCNSVHVSESSLSDWFIRVWTQLPGCCHLHLSRVHLLGYWCSNFLKILVEVWSEDQAFSLETGVVKEGRSRNS